MDLSARPLAPEPYDLLPTVPSFPVTSKDLVDGEPIPTFFTGLGDDVSPQLCWSQIPEETKSLMVDCFDPDAPTPAGFWHWSVVNIPLTIRELPTGAGAADALLPAGSFHVRNDGSQTCYMGPYPPQGDRPHRYVFAVHALNVPQLPVDSDASPTSVAFTALFHTLARGILTGTFAH